MASPTSKGPCAYVESAPVLRIDNLIPAGKVIGRLLMCYNHSLMFCGTQIHTFHGFGMKNMFCLASPTLPYPHTVYLPPHQPLPAVPAVGELALQHQYADIAD